MPRRLAYPVLNRRHRINARAGKRDRLAGGATRWVMPIFRKSHKDVEERGDETVEPTTCPHTTLIPRWDNAADVGNLDRAARFLCEGCNREFDAAEAARLRATEAKRVADTMRN